MSSEPSKERLLIFIVTYNAEKTVSQVLSRIPSEVFKDSRYNTEILIIDDSSEDLTFRKSNLFKNSFSACPLIILKNPVNLGYGGNQKLGYRYAIDHEFDLVALIHGDGQYAPEELPRLLEPLLTKTDVTAAVFGSRMMPGNKALEGGMPKYKYIGNKVLTYIQNKIINLNLSEWHSGYRLYSTRLLAKIPFEQNSNGFDFDTDIIIQTKASAGKIVELPIPTFYGDEISHVNGIQYACKIISTCLLFRIQKLNLLYNPKFDFEIENTHYQEKFSFESSHSVALKCLKKDDACLIIGCGPLELTKPFIEQSKETSVVDLFISENLRKACKEAWSADLDNFNLADAIKHKSFDKVLALDVIEHLKSPEKLCAQLRHSASLQKAEIIITTPNIAFLPIRLMLLFGLFNYGKRGILDQTHTRLFTRASLSRLLLQSGFEILEMRGIPAPIPLALGKNALSTLLLGMNSALCKWLPGLFSFQLFVRARPAPTVSFLLNEAKRHAAEELAKI